MKMLDSRLRQIIDPHVERVALSLAERGYSANFITATGLVCAVFCFIALTFTYYSWALLFLVLNRLCDGLDGAVARKSENGPSDFGAYFDIVSDFIFYAGVVFFFAVGVPDAALVAAFVIFSFIASGTTFLAHAILVEKQGGAEILLENQNKSKGFYYVKGLCEGTETIIFLVLICLFPSWFVVFAALFGILCWLTAAQRFMKVAAQHQAM